MGFKCGIVGLPNVGKSTLFNALTKTSIAAENYPFCTIDPNIGIVPVPDSRLEQLAKIVSPQEIIPALMRFVDIAGLVKGASLGEGLGNQFLAHIREVDAIVHVVRCFEDSRIIHVTGQVNPKEDIEIINLELLLADVDTTERALTRIGKNAKSGNKEAIAEHHFLERLLAALRKGIPARALSLSEVEQAYLKPLCLLTIKPILYVANVLENGFTNNPLLDQIASIAASDKAYIIPICAATEASLSNLEEQEKQEFLKELHLEEPGLDRLIRAGYKLLSLQTFFTAGPQEVRAWTISVGDKAPQASGRIHGDFEKGFIRAEVIAYHDFIAHGGETGAKNAGKWRLEGKNYVTQDGDVMHFRFNV